MISTLSPATSPSGGLTAFTATRPATPSRVATPLPEADPAPPPSTQLTLDTPPAADVVYARPQRVVVAPPARSWAWASPPQDSISALMARNAGKLGSGAGGGTAGALADAWRGLGGALLSRFAAPSATSADYRQGMVDLAPQAAAVTATDPTQTTPSALDVALPGAATVSLKIQTRSGETVALKITVNQGADGADAESTGLRVEVTSSGTLAGAESDAVARLAEGLDRALEGLGQPGKPKLDLAGLMAYDSGALASVDLDIRNPASRQALSSFSLHLGADQKTIAFKGKAGDIALNLDTATPLGPATPQQRQAAIQQHLQKIDTAAQRSHADATLAALFKDAFTQLHTAPAVPTVPDAGLLNPVQTRQVQPLQSGLMDFDAHFGGDFENTNAQGAVKETGRADYQLSQKTTLRHSGPDGALSITQTQSEKLDAHYVASRHGGMLDLDFGNYDIHNIQDNNTVTTMIETSKDAVTRAMRKTDQHQWHGYEELFKHRVEERREVPFEKSVVERLA